MDYHSHGCSVTSREFCEIAKGLRFNPAFRFVERRGDEVTESARFESSTDLETIDLNLLLSLCSQSLREDQEAGKEPM